MRRKIISTTVSNADQLANLGNDEEFVEQVTTTKTVGRQKRETKAADETPTPLIIETDDDDDDFEPVVSPYPEGTAAHKLWLRSQNPESDDETNFDQGNVLVVRKPDSPGEKFLVPCASRVSYAPLRNLDLATLTETDIEEMVRNLYHGGHYYLQYQIGNQLLTGWSCDLGDSPDAVARAESAATPAIVPVAPAASAVDPFDNFLDNLEKQKRMRDLMFGEEKERYERELAELRAMVANNKDAEPSEPQSEEFQLWKMAAALPDSEAKTRLIDKLTPTDDEGNKHWIGDVIKVVAENKDVLVGIVGSLIGGIAGGNTAVASPSMSEQMRSQPPVSLPPPVQHRFGQRKPPPDPSAELRIVESPDVPPAISVTDPPAAGLTPDGTITPERVTELSEIADDIAADDANAIDAEITEEVKDAKPARRGKNAAA